MFFDIYGVMMYLSVAARFTLTMFMNSSIDCIAIPGLPLLCSDPGMCPWMSVVDHYLVCILSYFVFELWDVLGRSVIGWLSLETKTSCPDFGLSARAGIIALERGLYTSSISCLCKTSADVIFALERVCLRSSGGARAGRWPLERVVLPEYKFWEGEIHAQADWFSRSSGSALFLCLGARAGLIALERVQIFVLGARASCSPLEWVMRI
ncbi:hypothetical protein CsSME_00003315 [Camellia sinensis var. sinensis]